MQDIKDMLWSVKIGDVQPFVDGLRQKGEYSF